MSEQLNEMIELFEANMKLFLAMYKQFCTLSDTDKKQFVTWLNEAIKENEARNKDNEN